MEGAANGLPGAFGADRVSGGGRADFAIEPHCRSQSVPVRPRVAHGSFARPVALPVRCKHRREYLPTNMMMETKIPNATPAIIAMYALSDEQALLAKVRYNRLVAVFTGVTCYSLQSHLRTAI